MTVTIDKFGRVLIPKPLRDRLGLEPGTTLSLGVREGGDGAPTLELQAETDDSAFVRKNGRLIYVGEIDDFDVVEAIREQRRERSQKLMGPLGEDEGGA